MKPSRHANQICLIVINVIFLLAGGSGFAAGLLAHLDPNLLTSILAERNIHLNVSNPSVGIVVAVICLICIIISLIGCLGALCKLTAVLGLYSFLLLILMAVEISGAIFISHLDGNSSTYIERSVEMLIHRYNESRFIRQPEHMSPVRILFGVFHCCGVTGPEDFNNSYYRWVRDNSIRGPNSTSSFFPLVCCLNVTLSRDVRSLANVSAPLNRSEACLDNVTARTAFTRGCLMVIQDFIESESFLIIASGIGAFLLEVMMIMMSARQCLVVRKKLIYERSSVNNKGQTSGKAKPSILITSASRASTDYDDKTKTQMDNSVASSSFQESASSSASEISHSELGKSDSATGKPDLSEEQAPTVSIVSRPFIAT